MNDAVRSKVDRCEAMQLPTEAVAIRESQPMPVAAPSIWGSSEPQQILAKAADVATTLKDVVRKQGLLSVISGKEYPKCEAWTLLGTLLGVFPVLCWTRQVEGGWEARVEARTRDGSIVGAAEAQCLKAERNWANRDDFALRSMAQTRATAKCLRMPLGFVMTLGGFEPTPAEEMVADHPAKAAPATAPAKPAKPDPELEKRIVEKTRLRMVEVLTEHKLQNAAKAMFEQLGWLLPTEDLTDLPDARVPRSKNDMDCLLQAVNRFIESGDMPQTPTTAPQEDQVPGAEVEAKGHPDRVIGNETWWDTIVVVPHKGQSKSEYVKNPDTIKSLYLAAKMGDEEASKRLFGLAHYFDPKPWTGKDGKERPPSDADKHFRAALNSFLSWHDQPAKQNDDVPTP